MRIRSIKPEFFKHEGLFDAESESGLPLRVAFAGLWCAADREGRFKWRPRALKTDVLPYDDVDFARVLDALTTHGFVVCYESQGEEFGWIPGFARNQVINARERESDLPAPPESTRAPRVDDACPTRAPRVDDACPTRPVHAHGEGKGKEGNMEGEGVSARKRASPPSRGGGGGKSAKAEWSPDDTQRRLNALFHRRDSTRWSAKEVKALRGLEVVEADLKAIEAYYRANPKAMERDIRRRDLLTLLNNWPGEVDRANAFNRNDRNSALRPPATGTAARNEGAGISPKML